MLRTLRDNPRVMAVVFAALLILPVLLAERLAIPITYVLPDGGRVGILLRLLYLIPIATGALSLLVMPEVFAKVLRVRYAAVGVVCILADLGVYLLSGVLEKSVKATLSLSIATAASMGAVLTGIALFRIMPAAIDWLIATATSISAVVGAFQVAEFYGYSTTVGRLIANWDQSAAEAVGSTVAWWRAQGLAMNPNMYTPFAIVGFIWAVFGARTGPTKWITLVSSAAIALLGQSRTTLTILVILLLLALIRAMRFGEHRQDLRRATMITAGVLVVGSLLAAGVIFGRASGSGAERMTSAAESVRVLLADPLADESIAARVAVWESTVKAIGERPMGHFERSRFILKPLVHPHNEFLLRALYAGPLWLVAHLVFLTWLWVWLRPQGMRWIGVAIAVALLVNGITEPLNRMHPFTVLLYLVIGAAMLRMAEEEPTSPSSA